MRANDDPVANLWDWGLKIAVVAFFWPLVIGLVVLWACGADVREMKGEIGKIKEENQQLRNEIQLIKYVKGKE